MSKNTINTYYDFKNEAGEFHCPLCGGPIVRSVSYSNTNQEVWKCCSCFHETENVDVIDLVIAPPVDVSDLLRFIMIAKKSLCSNIVQIIGSCQDGCVVTMRLAKPALLEQIQTELERLCEVKVTQKKPSGADWYLDLLEEVGALHVVDNSSRGVAFLDLAYNQAAV